MTTPPDSPTWKAVSNERFGAVAVVEADSQRLLADLSAGGGTFEEKVERARIMAAAPALLAALEHMERGLLSIAEGLFSGLPARRTARELYCEVFNALQEAASVDLQIVPEIREEQV